MKKYQNQRGIAHLIVVIIAVIALAAALITAMMLNMSPVDESEKNVITHNSGIQGHAIIYPATPTCGAGDSIGAGDCTKPYLSSYSFTVKNTMDDQIVATITTSADGKFKHALAEGDYVIEASAENMSAQPQNVHVEKNAYAEVVISFDSGIR